MQERNAFVRRTFVPTEKSAARLLEALGEVEAVDPAALPGALVAAHAVLAARESAGWLRIERVALEARSAARAGSPLRLAGTVVPEGEHARARVRARQLGPVLELEARGRIERRAPRPGGLLPWELATFAQALEVDPSRYAREGDWPAELVVALAAAGVEAENEPAHARLVRLAVDFPPPKVGSGEARGARLGFAIDGVRPVSGDTARVVFRVTEARGRLVARGDALIVSALARSAAAALGRAA